MWVIYYVHLNESITFTQDSRTYSFQYLNERGQIIFDKFTSGHHSFYPYILHLESSGASMGICEERSLVKHSTPFNNLISPKPPPLESILADSGNLQKHHLWDIYRNIHLLLGFHSQFYHFDYPRRCPHYPGYARNGRVVIDLEEWTLQWSIHSKCNGLQQLKCVLFFWMLTYTKIHLIFS